jgi:predicted phosphodiesterase
VRYLILSDLHANKEALEAVLRDAAGAFEQTLCCGDLVGYGADPNLVVEWVREHCDTVVRGNHDRACAGLDDLEWFNPAARQAALWTQRTLTRGNADYVRALPKGPVLFEGIEIVHGSPYDEDEYVLAPHEAGEAFHYLERRLAFFGHTHVQGVFVWNHSRVETAPRPSARNGREVLDIDPACAYLVNPGSVGQPRDGDPRAGYALYDTGSGRLSLCRVAYDVAAAQLRIREAGLPPVLADRLALGR